jgi:DNA-binding beta-propeller fold protein YncE
MEGCGSTSSFTPVQPDFYISHVQDPNAVWLKSGANIPAPLTIALPPGTSLNDLAAIEYKGPSDWLYLVSRNPVNGLVIVNKVGSNYQVVTTVPVGTGPFGLAIDGSASFAYISNNAGDSVTVVDLTSNQPVSTIALPTGSQPRGIAVTPDGKTVYVANQSTGTLSVIDAMARAVCDALREHRRVHSRTKDKTWLSSGGPTMDGARRNPYTCCCGKTPAHFA